MQKKSDLMAGEFDPACFINDLAQIPKLSLEIGGVDGLSCLDIPLAFGQG